MSLTEVSGHNKMTFSTVPNTCDMAVSDNIKFPDACDLTVSGTFIFSWIVTVHHVTYRAHNNTTFSDRITVPNTCQMTVSDNMKFLDACDLKVSGPIKFSNNLTVYCVIYRARNKMTVSDNVTVTGTCDNCTPSPFVVYNGEVCLGWWKKANEFYLFGNPLNSNCFSTPR